jgi:hypothetical protein
MANLIFFKWRGESNLIFFKRVFFVNKCKVTQDKKGLLIRTNENIKKVVVLVLSDRRIRVSMIVDEVGI